MIIKFLKGEKMERHNLQLLFIIIFTLFIYTRFFLKRAFLNDYTIASCSVSLILCIIVLIVGYVEVFVKMPMIQATAILHPIEVITVPEPVNENTEKRLEVDLSISKKFLDNQSKFSEMFEDLMEKQHYYTTKGLTLDDVAKSMQTNKTYISLLVNNIYKKSFPDYINSKRVEFAKKLLKESKGSMKMEEIADKSGFQSAAQLARKVKEIEGLTLREWITIANQIKN
jgi:YesN/AraC family two-component response regulator